jgi:hypothetical protein
MKIYFLQRKEKKFIVLYNYLKNDLYKYCYEICELKKTKIEKREEYEPLMLNKLIDMYKYFFYKLSELYILYGHKSIDRKAIQKEYREILGLMHIIKNKSHQLKSTIDRYKFVTKQNVDYFGNIINNCIFIFDIII